MSESIAVEVPPKSNFQNSKKTQELGAVSDPEVAEDSEVTKKSKKRKREGVTEATEDEEIRRKREKKERKRLKKLERAAAKELEGNDAMDVDADDASLAIAKAERREKKAELKKSKKSKMSDSIAPEPSTSTSTAATTPSTTPGPELPNSTPPTASQSAAYLSTHSITISGDVSPVLSFDQLALPPKLRSALNGFKEPTPIQACAWPALMAGKDVVGIAETGSGKTLAFGLPALSRLIDSPIENKQKKGPRPSVLVVAPTRELAIQTHDTLLALGEPFGILSVCLFGGMDKGAQKKALLGSKGKAVRIVVGTPGRILDLLNEETLDLSGVSYLVLDEADRMLDKGFENDIRAIIASTADARIRQTLMFSATWPDSVRRLASTFLNDPVRITVGSDDLTANSKVEQIVEVFDDPRSKDSRLSALLQSLKHHKNSKPGSDESRILVFVLYKKEAARVEGTLRRMGYSVGAIHGDLGQAQRLKALDEFKTGKTGLLVATDVAARGLDIPNVGAVINYSFPLTVEDYVHRIGRTGRGGRSGKSITFFTGENHERALAGELMRVLRDSGFTCEGLKKFPMTVKKKEHSAYGAWFKEMGPGEPVAAKKIKFD